MSPSSRVTGRSPISRNRLYRTLAIVDFPAPLKPVRKNGKALSARRRIGFAQFVNDFREDGPVRYAAAAADTLANLRRAQGNGLHPFGHLTDLAVFIFKGKINKFIETNNGHPDLFTMGLCQAAGIRAGILRGLPAILRPAAMVSSDNEMGAPEIF